MMKLPAISNSFLIRLAAALFTFIVCLRQIGDFDYWTHLALGRAYWQAGTISIGEPFVLSRLGQSLGHVEWLFQLLLYPLHSVGSDAAVCVTIALIAALVVYILSGLVSRSLDYGTALAIFLYCAVSASAMQFRFLPRPEVPAYLLLAICLALVWLWQQNPDRRKLILITLIFGVWVQLHLTWTIGVVLVALSLMMNLRRDFWHKQLTTTAGRLFVVLVVSAVAVAGYFAAKFALHIYQNMGISGIYGGITEMRPLWDFPPLLMGFGSVALVALALSWGDSKGRAGRLLIWAVALFLGILVVRNVAIALLGMMPVAIDGFVSQRENGLQKWNTRLICVSLVAALIVMIGQLRNDASSWGVGVQWQLFPRDAAAFVKERNPSGVVFNNWDCGGYLDWAWNGAPPTFLDGRIGSSDVVKNHDALVDGIDPPTVIKSLGINTILVQPLYHNNGRIIPGLFWLLGQPEWQLVRATDALVFMKEPLPTGAEPLPSVEAWRAIYRYIARMPADQSPFMEHLPYSQALAMYYSGDFVSAQRALAEAKQGNPKLLPAYRAYFLFPTES